MGLAQPLDLRIWTQPARQQLFDVVLDRVLLDAPALAEVFADPVEVDHIHLPGRQGGRNPEPLHHIGHADSVEAQDRVFGLGMTASGATRPNIGRFGNCCDRLSNRHGAYTHWLRMRYAYDPNERWTCRLLPGT